MTFQAQLVLILWIPISLFLFARFSPQRAIIISLIAAWLFLPQSAGFVLQGLPDYSKHSAACYAILLGVLIFDFQRVTTFRPSWLDLPMGVWCLVPLISSITSGMGIYPGLSAVFAAVVEYGIPYFLGRIYIGNLAGLRQLAMGILLGGIIYVPLSLFEVRMSPMLHNLVYGYYAAPIYQQIREGGWRPTVFMRHGLSVGMWMMAATLIAIWLWQSGNLKKLWDIPINWLVVVLLGTFILVRSIGSYVYLIYGVVTLFAAKSFRRSLPLLLLILGIYFYLFLGTSGLFSAQSAEQLTNLASAMAGSERAGSLRTRLDNEQLLSERGRQRWLFGWGPGQSHMYAITQEGDIQSLTVTDSVWIISYGQYGIVGVVAFFSWSLLPAFCFWLRYPARSWFTPQVAPAAALSVIITLFMVDCSFNAQINPVYFLVSGGIAGLVSKKPETVTGNSRFLPTKAALLQARQQNRRLLLNGKGSRTSNSRPSS